MRLLIKRSAFSDSRLAIRVKQFALSHEIFFFADLQKDDSLFSVYLVDDDYFKWEVWFIGPPGTLYENGSFHAILTFPTDFPNSPPHMRFVEEMWHPNST